MFAKLKKRKGKKILGFTLIELLTVIVILAVILLIAVPSILDVIEKAKEKSYINQTEMMEGSARIYVATNPDIQSVIPEIGDSVNVTLQEMMDEGILIENPIDPRDNEKMPNNSYVKITRDINGSIIYEYINDEEVPVITIIGDSSIDLLPGDIYVEEGATALDNIDGDLTSDIVTTGTVDTNTVGEYIIEYKVTDFQGNVTTVYRTVRVLDVVDPVLTITGDNPLEVNKGEAYVDPGFSAIDDIDGDISGNVVITGTVDTNTVGTYTLTYTIADSWGNEVSDTRSVEVVLIFDGTVNIPVLSDNMYPVKWNGSNWIVTTVDDSSWYDYVNKQWANVQIQSVALNPGDVLSENNLNMYVWIPRYSYNFGNGGYHSDTANEINIQFEENLAQGTVPTTNTSTACTTSDSWCTHPAFRFGSQELRGIWVAKFEISGTLTNLVSRPSVYSLGMQTPNSYFEAAIEMTDSGNPYGFDTCVRTYSNINDDTECAQDTHMMKNVDWGAIAYLSNSTYGKNAEVYINNYVNNGNTLTGCGAGSANAGKSYSCLYDYKTLNSGQIQQSTTGNIYGVYDMNGGSIEFLAAQENRYTSNTTYLYNKSSTKYVDLVTSYSLQNTKGMAMYETSEDVCTDSGICVYDGDVSWYADTSRLGSVMITRGGLYDYRSDSGIFNFQRNVGTSSTDRTTRISIVVE